MTPQQPSKLTQEVRKPIKGQVQRCKLRFEPLEDRLAPANQTLTELDRTALLSGLESLVTWSDTELITLGEFAQGVPLAGETLGKLVAPGETISTELVALVREQLDNDGNMDAVDTQSLTDSLNGIPMLTATDESTDTLIQIDIQWAPSLAKTLPLELGEQIEDRFGIRATGEITLQSSLQLDFDLGYDRTPGLTQGEASFVNFESPFTTGVQAAFANNFDVAVRLGLLDASVTDGSVNLNADVEVTISEPSGDNRLTVTELLGTPIDSLASSTTMGSADALNVTLPVTGTLSSGYSATGTLTVTDADVFNEPVPQIAFNAPDGLVNFKDITPGDLGALLTQVGSAFQTVSGALNPVDGIPFVTEDLNSFADFAGVFDEFVSDLYDVDIRGVSEYTLPQLPDVSDEKSLEVANFSIILTNPTAEPPTVSEPFDVMVEGGAKTPTEVLSSVQAGLTAAGLDGKVEVAFTDPDNPETSNLTFRALTSGDRLNFRYGANEAGTLQLGFERLLSNAVFRFDTLGELTSELNTLLSPNTASLEYAPAERLLTLGFELEQTVSEPLMLMINEGFDLGMLGSLGLTGKADATVTTTVNANFTAGLDLSPIGGGFLATTETTLGSLPNADKIDLTDGNADLVQFTLRDGTNFQVNFEGLTPATLGGVIDAIDNAAMAAGVSDGELVVAIIPDDPNTLAREDVGLQIQDTTTPDGMSVLAIQSLAETDMPASLLGFVLGILGSDRDGDGIITGTPLHGDTLLKRAFLTEGSEISASLQFDAKAIELSGSLGLLEVGVVGGGADFTVGGSLKLADPGTGAAADGRILLSEFSPQLAGVTITAGMSAPANGQLDADAEFSVAIAGGSPITVMLAKADTMDNAMRGELASDLNGVLDSISFPAAYNGTPYEGGTLGDVLSVTVIDKALVFQGAIPAISIAGAEELGFAATENATSGVLTPEFLASGKVTLPTTVHGLLALGESMAPTVNVELGFSANSPIVVTPSTPSIDPDVEALLNSLSDLSLGSVVDSLESVANFLRDSELGIFTQPLPLVNQSVRDLVGLVDDIEAALASFRAEVADLSNTLTSRIGELRDALIMPPGMGQASLFEELNTAGQGELAERLVQALNHLEDVVTRLPRTLDLDALVGPQIPIEILSAINYFSSQAEEFLGDTTGVTPERVEAFTTAFFDLRTSLPVAESLGQFFFRGLGLDTLVDKTGLDSVAADLATASADLSGDAKSTFDNLHDQLIAALALADDRVDVVKLIDFVNGFTQAVSDFEDALADADLTDDFTMLGDRLRTAFPAFFDVRLVDDASGQSLEFRLNYQIAAPIPNQTLDFSAATSLFGLPASVQSGGTLEVEVGAMLNLGFGVDLASLSDPVAGFFLTTDSDIEADLQVKAEGITLEASFGGITATLGGSDSYVRLSEDPSDEDAGPIAFRIGLDKAGGSVDSDQRVQLTGNDLTESLKVSAPMGGFEADLEVTAPLAGGSDTNLTLALTDVTDFSSFQLVNFPTFDFSDLKLDLSSILNGVDELLKLLENSLQTGGVEKIPLIGDGLNDLGMFIERFRDEFFTPLKDELTAIDENLKDEAAITTAVQDLLFKYLGPGSGGVTGLNILAKPNSSELVTAATDIPVTVTLGDDLSLLTDPDASITVDFHFYVSESTTVDFDLGFDALKILTAEGEGGINLGVEFDVEFSLELNKQEGIKLILNEASEVTPDLSDPNNSIMVDPELELKLTVELTPDTSANVSLFFLKLGLSEAPGGADTGFTGVLYLDLSKGTDTEVPLAELLALEVTPNFQADIQVDLRLNAGVGGIGAGLNTNLPSIRADLRVDWDFAIDSGGGRGELQVFRLDDISLDIGGFLSGPVLEVLEGLDRFIEPIRPILAFLNAEVPLISEVSQLVGQGPFTFTDGIRLLGDGGDTVATVIDLLSAVSSFVGTSVSDQEVVVNFGDFILIDVPKNINASASTSLLDPGFTVTEMSDGTFMEETGPDSVNGSNNSLKGTFDQLRSKPGTSDAMGTPGLGIEFPLLDNPSMIVNVLLGKPVDLIAWDIPRLEASFTFNQIFGPIIPPFPVFATIGGTFGAFADFYVGLDTRGLQTGNFFDGIYFGDRDPTTPGGTDVPEVGLFMEFTAGAEINVVVAKAGVKGGVGADINANWNDPNEDGKYYLDEVHANAQRGLECIFDLEGALTAFLRAYLKIEIDLRFFTITIVDTDFTIIDATLFDFSLSCPPLPDPIPASIDADGRVTLHTGANSGARQPGAMDIADVVTIRGEVDLDGDGVLTPTIDKNGDGFIKPDDGDVLGEDLSDEPNAIVVEAFGIVQILTGVTSIYADLGKTNDEDDILTVHPDLDIPLEVYGGGGDDEITTGKAGDTVDAGAGTDTVRGGAGNDSILGGEGSDNLFGNAGGDTLRGGNGDDAIYGGNNDGQDVGDTGDSLDGGGGNDRMFGHLGNDTLEGGQGADQMEGNDGDDIVRGQGDDDRLFGNEGNDRLEGGAGNDQLTGGVGSDTLIGGGTDANVADGNDLLVGGNDNDILIGDNGTIGSVILLPGMYGDDTVIGGAGNDQLYGQEGEDLLIGDGDLDAENLVILFDIPTVAGATYDDYLEGNQGSDTLQGGSGNDRLIGGSSASGVDDAADQIQGGIGDDVLLGDNGTVTSLTNAQTDPTGTSGADSLYGGVGNDVLFGGGSSDLLNGDGFGGSGNDVVVGDQGQITPTMIIASTGTGASDQITGASGNDTLLGGDGGDFIAGDHGTDVVIGDNGKVTVDGSQVKRVETATSDQDGNDQITGSNDADILLGGGGKDTINGGLTDDAADILLGDNGLVAFDDGSMEANTIQTTDPTKGDSDSLLGGAGNDTVIGGTAADTLLGDAGQDVLVGDHVLIKRDPNQVLKRVTSIDPGNGGNDVIDGNTQGDIALGGAGDDTITGGSDNAADILIGDNGEVVADDGSDEANDIFTIAPGVGGSDSITGGAGNDTVLGGAAGDDLQGNSDSDVILGDNGYIKRNASNQIELIFTTNPEVGGADTVIGEAGDDTILGGAAGDSLFGNSGSDVVIGDNGLLDYVVDSNPAQVDEIRTTDSSIGGQDTIVGDVGNDTLLGGAEDDTINGNVGLDIILGDNGEVIYHLDGDPATPDRIATTHPFEGGTDLIMGDEDSDTILGGSAGDSIQGNAAPDILIGDQGLVHLLGGQVVLIETTDTVSEQGGTDTIEGNDGNDTLLGGVEGDSLFGNDGDDLILGDEGRVDYLDMDTDPATLDSVMTTKKLLGGNDTIFGQEGRDTVFGGTADDLIEGGLRHDILLGDHGKFDRRFPANQPVESIDIKEDDGGGNDTIFGQEGDDFIYGQQGDDSLFGGAGEDDMLGGHNVRFGADGNDYMDGGADADVMLGDSGQILRTIITPQLPDDLNTPEWLRYPDPFPDVIREIIRFDDDDFLFYGDATPYGNDTMFGQDGRDIMRGQRGDDFMDGGADDDEMAGDLGNDTMAGGDEPDILIGDNGEIIRAFNADGTPRVNSNGFWHRDIALEETARVIGSIDVSGTDSIEDLNLANQILSADMVVLTGLFSATGERILNPDGSWATRLLLLDLASDDASIPGDGFDDSMDGGQDEDVVIGQRGNDTVGGGSENDLVIGDNATALAQYTADLPQILQGIRLIEDTSGFLALPFGGSVIVPDMAVRPREVAFTRPRLDTFVNVTPELQAIALDDALKTPADQDVVAYLTAIPDVSRHAEVLSGNDEVTGGGGDDLVIGDDLEVFAPAAVVLRPIDEARQDIQIAIDAIVDRLETLSRNADLLDYGVANLPTPAAAEIGNDVLEGGSGTDTVYADHAILLTPATPLSSPELDDFPTEATALYERLRLTQYALTDLVLVLEGANHAQQFALIQDSQQNSRTPTIVQAQDVVMFNDQANGNGGRDLIYGDHAVVVMPYLNAAGSWVGAVGVFTPDQPDNNTTEAALAVLETLFDRELAEHVRTQFQSQAPMSSQLSEIAFESQFNQRVGNDTLAGDNQDDILVGDLGLKVLPLVETTPGTDEAAQRLNRAIDDVLRVIEPLFRTEQPGGIVQFRYSSPVRDTSVDGVKPQAYADSVLGGSGKDVLFGDGALLRPLFESGVPLEQSSENASPLPGAGSDPDENTPFDAAGADIVKGQGGHDILFGGRGDDSMLGGGGSDSLFGGRGEDTLKGNKGNDSLIGGSETDLIRGGGGTDFELQSGDGGDDSGDAMVTPISNPVIDQLRRDLATYVGTLATIDPNAGMVVTRAKPLPQLGTPTPVPTLAVGSPGTVTVSLVALDPDGIVDDLLIRSNQNVTADELFARIAPSNVQIVGMAGTVVQFAAGFDANQFRDRVQFDLRGGQDKVTVENSQLRTLEIFLGEGVGEVELRQVNALSNNSFAFIDIEADGPLEKVQITNLAITSNSTDPAIARPELDIVSSLGDIGEVIVSGVTINSKAGNAEINIEARDGAIGSAEIRQSAIDATNPTDNFGDAEVSISAFGDIGSAAIVDTRVTSRAGDALADIDSVAGDITDAVFERVTLTSTARNTEATISAAGAIGSARVLDSRLTNSGELSLLSIRAFGGNIDSAEVRNSSLNNTFGDAFLEIVTEGPAFETLYSIHQARIDNTSLVSDGGVARMSILSHADIDSVSVVGNGTFTSNARDAEIVIQANRDIGLVESRGTSINSTGLGDPDADARMLVQAGGTFAGSINRVIVDGTTVAANTDDAEYLFRATDHIGSVDFTNSAATSVDSDAVVEWVTLLGDIGVVSLRGVTVVSNSGDARVTVDAQNHLDGLTSENLAITSRSGIARLEVATVEGDIGPVAIHRSSVRSDRGLAEVVVNSADQLQELRSESLTLDSTQGTALLTVVAAEVLGMVSLQGLLQRASTALTTLAVNGTVEVSNSTIEGGPSTPSVLGGQVLPGPVNLAILGGAGDNQVSLRGGRIDSIGVVTTSGRDVVSVDTVNLQELFVFLGAGDDQLNLLQSNGQLAILRGGIGTNDQLRRQNSNFGSFDADEFE